MTFPTSELELRAADERRRLQASLQELNSRVRTTVDVNSAVRKHLILSSLAVGLLGLLTGYSFGGLITRS